MFNENTFQVIEEIRRKMDGMHDQMNVVFSKSEKMITIDTIEVIQKQM